MVVFLILNEIQIVIIKKIYGSFDSENGKSLVKTCTKDLLLALPKKKVPLTLCILFSSLEEYKGRIGL